MGLRRIPNVILYSDLGLDFDPTTHTYSMDRRVFRSVTQVIDCFVPAFNSEYHSARIAARDGLSQRAVLDAWEEKAKRSRRLGNEVHARIEGICCRLQDTGFVTVGVGDCYKCQQVWIAGKWFQEHIELAQGWVAPECRIAYPSHSIAGTVDLIASNYEGVPAIIDWKTSETIETHGYSNMLPPFQRGKLALPNASIYHYFLQLNLYRRILHDAYHLEVDKMVVVHLTDTMFTEYDVPSMEDHVDKMLEVLDEANSAS